METYGVLKVLSLVVVWGIPAILVLAVAVFITLASTFAFGGLVSKLYKTICGHKCSQETGLKAHATA